MSLACPDPEQSSPYQVQYPFHHNHHDEMAINFQGFLYKPELCRKTCGFYGNPIWHGYCSRCWIEQKQKVLSNTDRHCTSVPLKQEKESKFNLKKRTDLAGEGINCTNSKCSPCGQSSKTYYTSDDPHSAFHIPLRCLHSLAQGDFSDFLKIVHRPDSQQLLSVCTNFIQSLQDSENLTLDNKGEQVQMFYHKIADNFSDDMAEERDRLLDNIEKLVMTRLYRSVFCPDGSQDEQKDLFLQKRIRSLHWVTPKMIQLPVDEEHQEVKDCLFLASTALIEMDSKRAPQDKLNCISKASHYLFKAVQSYKQEPATADDFLSCLIFTMFKTNPPRLASNLQYISRFCNPTRLVTGKGGYCFTNLCCAVSFIDTLDASSLGITDEEFEKMMKHQSEVLINGLQNEKGAVQQMKLNTKHLVELRCRQDVLIQKAEWLKREVRAWPQLIKGEVQEIICRFPLDINRTTTKLN
ncbi:rab5 GDP/GTP exchange factor isoform X2 [Bombina bombina]|nr:rab5 GDP/GTP exchange factor isoform X2 [Bombina bombina]XP_053558195.1 rab5 GDP/GTP exchange factor isoform X2 [Bombina bombina]